ncbi:TetR family transcriptional regulator [Sphingobium baderi]|jgi:AcrR family transcriptional regulator|nr:TetR family transcriptional regulator [Sphingobium baderi]
MTAATEEFAAFGIAGARVDRIARTARANKSQIYEYFGNKEMLFQAVLERQLSYVYQTVQFDPDDLPDYAGMLFDFAMDHPELMRLVLWNGLEQKREWPLEEALSLPTQVRRIRAAQDAGHVGTDYPADFLLTLIITLASAWTAANPFGISITPDAESRRPMLRKAILRAVQTLSCPPRLNSVKIGEMINGSQKAV